MRLALVASACLVALTLACSGDEDGAPTPTLFPQLEDTPGPTAVPPAVPTERPPLTEVPGVIWLIDVATANVVTLDANPQYSVANAWFDDETGTVVYQPIVEGGRVVSVRTRMDGTEVERGDNIPPPLPEPAQTRWQLDRVGTGEVESGGATFGLSDMWVEDTLTGERTLLATGLWQCTACDAFSAPAWSPSGRYVTYREHGGENRVFLSDVQAGTTRDLTLDRVDRTPNWSPAADLLLRPSVTGATVLEDVVAGTSKELREVPWPAVFDPTGRYIYSTASERDTIVANAAAGAVIATLEGLLSYDALTGRARHLFGPGLGEPRHMLVGTDESFVAAIGNGPGCNGTLLYLGDQPLSCAENAGSPVFSPDGSRVILARKTGETGRVDAATIQAIRLDIYEVLVVDMMTGEERLLAEGALGFETAPRVVWNAAGTHVLVSWPNNDGP